MLKKLLIVLFTLSVSMPAFLFAYTLSDNSITSLGSSKTVWIPFASDKDKVVYSLEIKKYEYDADGSFLVPYSTPSKWLLLKPTTSWLRMSCADEDVYDLGSFKDGAFEKQLLVAKGSVALLAKTFFCPIPDQSGELLLSVGAVNIDNFFHLIGFNPTKAIVKPFNKVVEAKTWLWHFEGDKVVVNSPRNYVLDCSNNSYKESLYNDGTNPYKKSEYMFQPIVNSLCLADDNLKLSGFDFDKNSQKFIISKGAHQAEVIAEQTKKPELKATLDDKIEKTLATCFKELPDKISFTWNRVSFTADEISTNPLTYTVVNLLRKKNESPYLVVNCESMSVTNKSGLSLKNDTTIDGLAYAGCKEISESLSDKVAVTNIKCDSTSNNYIATNTTSKPLPEIKPTKDIKYKPLQASNSIEGYSTLKSENEPKKFLDSSTFQKDGYADWNAQIAKSKNTGSSKFNDYEELKCAELGFKPKTIKYYDCIIKLKSKPSLEVAQTQTIQIATQRPIGDGSNEDTICQKYGFRVGDESYKNCRLELKIAQDRADDQLRQYELQKQAYEQQVRQYEEQDRIRRAAIAAAEEEKQRQNNIKLLTFGLGLASGRTFSEAAPALNGQAMYPRGYFNPPPLPPAEPMFNNVRLITPSGSANCQYSATWRELRCN